MPPPATFTYKPHYAPYATIPENARGRRISQPSQSERSCFQRDKDRIIHSSAFRRLKGKTQVFVAHEGDYYRTRLTHSLEVAQIARSLTRVLGLDEDLAECLALAHDMGHPPFGHSGEEALNAAMRDYGGFDHNAQTLRIVELLERRYALFDGLNLTWETLEGIAKHNGPVIKNGGLKDKAICGALPWALKSLPNWQKLDLHEHAGAEAQTAALSDDIAYNNHDLDDGLRAGLFSIDDVCEIPFVGRIFHNARKTYPDISENRLIHESIRDLISLMVLDALQESRQRLADFAPQNVEDIRALGQPVICFSDKFLNNDLQSLRAFLHAHMYSHYKVNRMMAKGARIVSRLFNVFITSPDLLPHAHQNLCNEGDNIQKAQVICDYIAGMTDQFAIDEYKKIFSVSDYL